MRRPLPNAAMLAWFAAIFVALSGFARGQDNGGVQMSFRDPARLQFFRDPLVLSFLPGNRGLAVMKKDPPEVIGNATRAGELTCDAHVIELAAPEYDLDPFAAESDSEAGYWRHLLNAINGNAMVGIATDVRFTPAFVDRYRRISPDRQEEFWKRFSRTMHGAVRPLVTFATGLPATDTELLARVRETTVPLLCGRVFERLPETEQQVSGWDFAVFRADSAPAPYTGQAAMPLFLSLSGGRPVLLRIAEPEFNAQLFWMATGAAGFYYDLPEPESPQYERQWKAIRAFAAFHSRLPNDLQLAPWISGQGVRAALVSPAGVQALLLSPGMSTSYTPPILPDRPESVGFWYRADTDQAIILPRIVTPAKMTLEHPSPEDWMYSHIALPKATEADTTTPQVRVDPDFDLVPE